MNGAALRSFVLRSGRMSRAQERAYAQHSPVRLPLAPVPLDFSAAFGNDRPVIAEIGFGSGEETAAFARANPGLNILGIEVFKAGIGSLLLEIERSRLTNIRIIEGDAALIFDTMIPPGSLAGIHIFYPDPWPKKRHHKRRLIRRPFTAQLARAVREGGYVYMVSDWTEYAEFAKDELAQTEGLREEAESGWELETRFSRKARAAGHESQTLFFRKQH